ncbi:MAG: hypothetical protein ABJD11_10880 [Gemmatimonadota bacterium]
MQEALTSPFSAWESFYVIVGSSAGALTGLQFVVMALIADSHLRSSSSEIDAFGTPTIVHFCAALLISAILSAPWHALHGARIVLLLLGVAGLGYSGLILRRTKRQSGYQPVFEDWLWHIILPALSYGALLISAVTLEATPNGSEFVVAGVSLLLLFVGIHNAWDSVAYVAIQKVRLSTEAAGEKK